MGSGGKLDLRLAMRARLSYIFGFVIVAMLFVGLSPSAAWAQDRYSTEATLGDGVDGLDPERSTTINSSVWAIEDIGDLQLVGGSFLEVRDRSNFARIPRPYLAAFDEDTGEYVPEFRTQPNGTVYDIDAYGDQIILAGEFSSVNSVSGTDGIAFIDPVTGEVDSSFDVDINASGVIRTIAVRGNFLYVGGGFNRIEVGGVAAPLTGLARINLLTKTLDLRFQPTIEGSGRVWGVDVASNGRVFVGGLFDSINGVEGTETLAALNPNGTLVAGWDHGFPFADVRFHPNFHHNGGFVNDLVVFEDKVFTAGAKHFWTAHSVSDGTRLQAREISNDGQRIDVVNGQIVIGCHCSSDTGSEEFADIQDRYVRVIDPDLLAEVESPTTNTEGGAGGWALSGDSNGCLWAGGQFSSTTVNGIQQPAWNLLRFCENGATIPSSGRAVPTFDDQLAPNAPTGLSVSQRASTVDLTWTSNDSQVGYVILRDGVVIGRTSGETYSDRFVSPGVHYWQVAAYDLAGNVSEISAFSTPINIAFPLNVATQGTATQINDFDANTVASNAIDGDTDPLIANGSVSRTLSGGSWFNLDLGAIYDVDYVRLHPSEVHLEVNNRLPLYRSTSPITATNRVEAGLQGLAVWTGPKLEEEPRVEFAELSEPVRYIRLLNGGRTGLAEIEVFTTPVLATPPAPAADVISPDAPAWKAVSDVSAGTLLRWGGASDNRGVVYYEVYVEDELVGRTFDSEILVASAGVLSADFTVVSYDAAGLNSGGIPEPVIVELESCSAVRNGQGVVVTWDASGDGIEDFVIRRSVDGSTSFWRGVADAVDSEFIDSDRDGELVYFVRVRGINGEIVAEVECDTTTDIVDPPVPVILSACSAIRNGQTVSVAWDANGEPNRYVVRRSVDGSSAHWRGVTDSDVSTFTDSDRAGELVYSVEAKDGLGNVIADVTCESEAGVTPPPVGDIEVLACSAIRNGQTVSVTWDANGEPNRYVVRRSVDGSSAHWRGVVDSDVSTFTDSDRLGELVYLVEAKDAVGTVVSSATCGEDLVADPVPEDLRTSFNDRSRIVIRWQPAASIEVEVDGVIVGTDSDGWYTIRDLDPGTEYSIRIRFEGSNTWSAPLVVSTNP